MTLRQIELVQQSFRLIQPIIDDVAILFYKRLFEIDPSLRHMFHRPRREQARLLAQTLSVVVKQIDRPSQLRRAVEALGERHVGYGVRDEHYAMVGEALLWTLEKGLEDAFTSEVRDAWVVAYSCWRSRCNVPQRVTRMQARRPAGLDPVWWTSFQRGI